MFLDASQLEDLASAMRSVSLTPSLEAACRSCSNTPERRNSTAITSAMPTVNDGQAPDAPTVQIDEGFKLLAAGLNAKIMLK